MMRWGKVYMVWEAERGFARRGLWRTSSKARASLQEISQGLSPTWVRSSGRSVGHLLKPGRG